MKNICKHISLFALGMVAVALLTSARVSPAPATSVSGTATLKIVSLPSALQIAGRDSDGQETHGDKGKTKG